MALGVMDIVSMTRTQEYTTIKQNEDYKGLVQQTVIGEQAKKDTAQQLREVRSSDNADWHQKKYDAKDKGANEYSGDGGKRKRDKQKAECVIVKGHQSFDMKI